MRFHKASEAASCLDNWVKIKLIKFAVSGSTEGGS
jgi:hypothetical protein